jgi:HK97 family phage major capsid protein
MPLLIEEAAKLSQDDMVRGVIEEIIDVGSLYALLPFVRVNGKAYDYNRESTLSEGTFLDPYDPVEEGAATFEQVITRLRILAGDVDLDNFLVETQSDTNSQLAIQLAAKAKGIARKFERTLLNGNNAVNSKEFDGITRLVTADMTLIAGANGAALTLGMLDELKDAVKNGADCFMMRSGTWRAIKGIMRATGGMVPEMLQLPNFGAGVPAFDGMPVVINDYLPQNETQGTNTATTSIYAMRLNETDGVHGIYGGASAGLRMEEIGTIQNKDAKRYRMKWYVGLALKSTQSLARLKGITNV